MSTNLLDETYVEARAKRYRDKAEECRRLAEQARSCEGKATYVRLADSYEVMARHLDVIRDDLKALAGR
jgi:hypothetical protein